MALGELYGGLTEWQCQKRRMQRPVGNFKRWQTIFVIRSLFFMESRSPNKRNPKNGLEKTLKVIVCQPRAASQRDGIKFSCTEIDHSGERLFYRCQPPKTYIQKTKTIQSHILVRERHLSLSLRISRRALKNSFTFCRPWSLLLSHLITIQVFAVPGVNIYPVTSDGVDTAWLTSYQRETKPIEILLSKPSEWQLTTRTNTHTNKKKTTWCVQ